MAAQQRRASHHQQAASVSLSQQSWVNMEHSVPDAAVTLPVLLSYKSFPQHSDAAEKIASKNASIFHYKLKKIL